MKSEEPAQQPGVIVEPDDGLEPVRLDLQGKSYFTHWIKHDVYAKGRWHARIEGERFQGDMAPGGGVIRVQVLVGGAPVSDQTFLIQKHATTLSFGG